MVVSPREPRAAGRPPRRRRSTTSTSPAHTPPTRSAGGSRRCCIRRQTVDDGKGPVLQGGLDAAAWTAAGDDRRRVQPEGRRRQDDDLHQPGHDAPGPGASGSCWSTPTRSPATCRLRSASTGPDRRRRLAGRVDGRPDADASPSCASAHPSGLEVVVADDAAAPDRDPRPGRVAEAITVARRGFDFVIVDLHPSYSPLNRAIFERADRILVPVTPDVPALRAAVQLRDLAAELGCRDRLAMVVNRANSGVSVADMETDRRDAGDGAHPVRRPAVRPGRQRGPDRRSRCTHGRRSPRTSTRWPTGCSGRQARPSRPPRPSFRLFGRAQGSGPAPEPPRGVPATSGRGPASSCRRRPPGSVSASRPPIDLLDAAQVEAVDQDRVDLGAVTVRSSPSSAVASTTGTNISVARSSSRSGSDPGNR